VIYVGELQSLNLEIIKEAISKYLSDLGVPFEDISVVEEKASFTCNKCGFNWGFSDIDPDVREFIHFLPEAVFSFVRCPNCGSRDYDVKSGRLLKIRFEV